MADTTVNKEIETLRSDLDRLRGDIASLTAALADAGARQTTDRLDALKQAGQQFQEKLVERAHEVRRIGDAGLEAVEQQIGGHPLASIGLAFGLGWLVGKTIRN